MIAAAVYFGAGKIADKVGENGHYVPIGDGGHIRMDTRSGLYQMCTPRLVSGDQGQDVARWTCDRGY